MWTDANTVPANWGFNINWCCYLVKKHGFCFMLVEHTRASGMCQYEASLCMSSKSWAVYTFCIWERRTKTSLVSLRGRVHSVTKGCECKYREVENPTGAALNCINTEILLKQVWRYRIKMVLSENAAWSVLMHYCDTQLPNCRCLFAQREMQYALNCMTKCRCQNLKGSTVGR